MFGYVSSDRPRRTEEIVATLRQAWSGEPFSYRGRTVRVTPTPFQPGGPKIALGGKTDAAARRAARIADSFVPSDPACWEAYRDELRSVGRTDPGPASPSGGINFVHVADDPDAAWSEIAPYALYEMNAYGKWLADAGLVGEGSYSPVKDIDELRATGVYRTMSPPELLSELAALPADGHLVFHPLMGGIPPSLAWESLRLFEREVHPMLRAQGRAIGS